MKLRKLEQKDAPRMLSWMLDDSVTRYLASDFGKATLDTCIEFIESSRTDTENLHLACVDAEDTYLGTVSLKHIDPVNSNAEYAISFCKEAQGTGAARFATDEILKIAFEEYELEKVYLNVVPDNTHAEHFYQKRGFVYEGEFKKHIRIKGALKDLRWYRLLKEEWLVL